MTKTPSLKDFRRIVVKVGSSLLVDAAAGMLKRDWLDSLTADIAELRNEKRDVLVVSSGAIALARAVLKLPAGALKLEDSQAAAAVGQIVLARAWSESLSAHGIAASQVLLTLGDTEERRRYLNARSTIDRLLQWRTVPVINENDTVATEEIRYGDNDRLAARVAQMVGADLLVLLSDIDGLYSADPRHDPQARHIPLVTELTPEIDAMAGGVNAEAGVGSGGMATKLAAARIAASAGCATLIALGAHSAPMNAVEAGGRSTLIEARTTPSAAYKAWIAGSLAPQGTFIVDAGAATALKAGKSLLPAGVRVVEGRFEKGDAVLVRDEQGGEIARGLSRYDAVDAEKIAGARSSDIEALLGYTAGATLIHADDLALSA